jgi:hypothetical protein
MNGGGPVKDDDKEPSSSSFASVFIRTEGVEVDSGLDFLSLLNSGSDGHSSDEEIRSDAARTVLHAFGGVSGSSGKRWMMAPLTSALETICVMSSTKFQNKKRGNILEWLPPFLEGANQGKKRVHWTQRF